MKLLVSYVKLLENATCASIGWTASVLSHIDKGIKFELHAGALPFCYPRPHNYVLFYRNSKNIAFKTVNVLAFHKTLRLKDFCSNSDCFSD